MTTALSTAPFAAALLAGPPRTGVALGHGYFRFGDRAVAVTPPGAPRMPNGIEGDLIAAVGAEATIGGGELCAGGRSLSVGELWDPRPVPPAPVLIAPRRPAWFALLAGRGSGLTPLGDDILIGYLAGCALAGAPQPGVARVAGRRTTALSATLLECAAVGELPEPAHALVECGDIRPLLSFGSSSGRGIALGLALALPSLDVSADRFTVGACAC